MNNACLQTFVLDYDCDTHRVPKWEKEIMQGLQ